MGVKSLHQTQTPVRSNQFFVYCKVQMKWKLLYFFFTLLNPSLVKVCTYKMFFIFWYQIPIMLSGMIVWNKTFSISLNQFQPMAQPIATVWSISVSLHVCPLKSSSLSTKYQSYRPTGSLWRHGHLWQCIFTVDCFSNYPFATHSGWPDHFEMFQFG